MRLDQPRNAVASWGLALLAGLALGGATSCTSVNEGSSEESRTVFWSFFATGKMGPSDAPEMPDNDAMIGSSAPGLLGSSPPITDPVVVEPVAYVEPYEAPLNWYTEFGDQIMVHSTTDAETGDFVTYITKPYRFPLGRGQKLIDLMKFWSDFKMVVIDSNAVDSAKVPGDNEVWVTNLAGWDTENTGDIHAFPPVPMEAQSIGDRVVVTAEANLLYDVEDFVNVFMSEVPQIEIEAKIITVLETDEMYLGIRPPDGVPMFDFPDGKLFDAFDYTLPSGASANQALLTVSGIHDGTTFNAVLEAVAALENVEVDSRPKIAVREGSVASIEATEDVPYYSFSGISSGASNFNASLSYKNVGIKLYVSPHIVGSKTVSLFVEVESSAESGSIVTFVTDSGSSLSTPRITKQVARTTVYLEPGQAVIIAGLTTEKKVETERKVPLLGDIPYVGRLFRSNGTKTVRSHTLFYIKPRILQGIDRSYDF